MSTSKSVHFVARPTGNPVAENFKLVESDLPEAKEGEVLIKNAYMSVDPYMRGVMRYAPLGQTMIGGAIGQIIESKNPDFAEGDYVINSSGWCEHAISNGEGLIKVDPELAPLSAYLGVLGMPGLTAYGGLLVTGGLQDGETLFVSAASGAVGSIVGQIAKIKGCTVIGSAGSDEKVKQLTEEYGFDHAFNYKTANVLEELRTAAPEGIDVYFENVGGPQLEAALTTMRTNGRIPVCGMIAHYNDHGTASPGPTNLTEIIYKRIMIKGFVVTEFADQREAFVKEMSAWIASGEVKYQETIYEGIENAHQAFMDLFTGANNGKMLVKL
ncbi:MAG: NADPH-dependent curcumin reductase CurA [Candidatus Azotimanducaceae bacterium]|jgi:NADPH-dependent curcumin reductase CurA